MYLDFDKPHQDELHLPRPHDARPRPRRSSPAVGPGQRAFPRYGRPAIPPPGGPIQIPTPRSRPPLPRLRWLIPGLGLGLGIGDGLDHWIDPVKDPFPFKHNQGGWTYRCDAGRQPGAPPYGPPSDPNNGPYVEFFAGQICNLSSGQVPSGSRRKMEPWVLTDFASDSAGTMILSDSALTPALRMRHDWVWNRSVSGYRGEGTWQPVGFPGLGPAIGEATNPNLDRARESDPVADWPMPQPPEPAPQEWQWSDTPPGEAPPRAHSSRPPPKGEKENKNLSKAAKIGIWLWRMMDTISELSEIGGSLYKALPEDIRKQANCGGGTNIGQYGSDVNKCMVETLYKHWDKLDGDKAVREIAKNIVEDMTVGQFHKWLGKVVPPGISLEKTLSTHAIAQLGVEKYIAQRLGELFDKLGL